MKLTIFQSGSGDCVLLEGANSGRVLIDGGDKETFGHIEANLGQHLDAVYVSHIDSDHIAGVLRLLENAFDWKVHDFHHQQDPNSTFQPPDNPRPPSVGGLWHNAFHDLITRNRGRIEDLLAASAPVLASTGIADAVAAGSAMANIATSIPEALRVSQIIKPQLLDIPLNAPPGRPNPGQLLLVEEPNLPFAIGSLAFSLIGPTKGDLRKLRTGWNKWLRNSANQVTVKKIRAEMRERVERFANSRTPAPDLFDLGNWNGVPDFKGVTPPNTASLMFLVKDNDDGRTALFTGDSQQDLILANLKTTGHLANGSIHVDVLKVAHHGSENNTDLEFAQAVTADHYVFCGNGSHGNPNPDVLDHYFNSRAGTPTQRAHTPEAQDNSRPFTFWFSTTSNAVTGTAAKENFDALEAHISTLQQRSGRLQVKFNQGDFIELPSQDAPFL